MCKLELELKLSTSNTPFNLCDIPSNIHFVCVISTKLSMRFIVTNRQINKCNQITLNFPNRILFLTPLRPYIWVLICFFFLFFFYISVKIDAKFYFVLSVYSIYSKHKSISIPLRWFEVIFHWDDFRLKCKNKR